MSWGEYRRLDNLMTCILQQHWPANEISITGPARHRLRSAEPVSGQVESPHSAEDSEMTALLAAAHPRGHREQNGTIRCAITGRSPTAPPKVQGSIAPSSGGEKVNPNNCDIKKGPTPLKNSPFIRSRRWYFVVSGLVA